MSFTRNSSFDRRSLIKVSSAVAGGALIMPSVRSVAGQTPVASPVDLPAVIESSVEGVPNAYTRYPDAFKSVDETPGDGSIVRMATLSYNTPRSKSPRTHTGRNWNPAWV